MASRSLSVAGFRLHLEVPDRSVGLAARVRRRLRRPRAGPAGGAPSLVEVTPLPSVQAQAREPQRALDFLRDPSLAGDGRPSPSVARYLAQAEAKRREATTLADTIASYPWYHTIELPGSVTTPGSHDLRPVVDLVGLPDRLDGLRALDVATYDGFWAFELERRGAEVVAIDLPSTAALDWPTGARDVIRAEGLDLPIGQPFRLAAEALGSSVRRVDCSVYDLDPDALGRFDLVMVGDLLLHLEHPLAALRAIRSVTDGTLVMIDRYHPAISGDGRRLLEYVGGWDGLEWWRPSLEALVQMVVDAGFEHVEVRHGLRITNLLATVEGWDRAVIHARTSSDRSLDAAGPRPR